MGRHCYLARKTRKKTVSVSEVWLVPLLERFYEPNKGAIVAVAVVLLPFCIRFVIPSVEMTKFVIIPLPLPLPLPKLWNVMHSWLTPPMLFLLLNLVIGTIAVTSTRDPSKKKKKKKKKKNNNNNNNKINNAISIPWNTFGTHEDSFEEYIEEEERAIQQSVSTPFVEPSNPNPILLPKKIHKPPPPGNPNPPVKPHERFPLVEPPKPPSLGEPHPSLSFSHMGRNKSEGPAFVGVLEVPPTGQLMRSFEDDAIASTNGPTTDELNAKADDFIQKFKQQLMLQRLQSYRERKRAGK